MHLLDLPSDIFRDTILGSLSVKDIARFGCAMTNTHFRPFYLHNILPTVHIPPDECQTASYASMKWMMQRQMRISNILITDESEMSLIGDIALHCCTLESLTCKRTHIPYDVLLDIFRSNPLIQHVEFSNCETVCDSLLHAIAQLCPHLHSISLQRCKHISDEGILSLLQVGDSLHSLDLSYNGQITDVGVIPLLHLSPNIRTAIFNNCRKLSNATLEVLATHCPTLQHLNVRACYGISDAGVLAVAEECCQLRHVDVSCCSHISDNAIIALATQCPHITTLSLSCCSNLTDVALMSIGQNLKELRSVYLSYCAISDQGLLALTNCPVLLTIDTIYCEVSESVRGLLQAHCYRLQREMIKDRM